METQFVIGCDIAQDSFTFCLRTPSQVMAEGLVVNTAKAIKTWLSTLKKSYGAEGMQQLLFVMEHTGIYSSFLLQALHERSIPVCMESAVKIKYSQGMTRGKNDKIDAQRIAEYGVRNGDRLKRWQPKRAVLVRLQLLIRMRERLVKARMDLSRFNQDAMKFMSKADSQLVIAGTAESLKAIQRNIQQAEDQIEKLIKADTNLKRLAELVTSVDGVGMVTCSAVLVKTNEFQDFNNHKKFACTAGIAPFEHSSGTSIRGKMRVSHKAHKDLKKLLHLCAVGSIGRKGELQDYYLRKVAQGKNKMSVINAVRNKIVARIFAVVRDGVMYQKNYQYNLQMS